MVGDECVVPVLNKGTANFSLKGKAVLDRNTPYVPDICNPLFFLSRHTTMPGCGTLMFQGMDLHILFPHNTLQINGSVDNLVTYYPMGVIFKPQRLDYTDSCVSRLSACSHKANKSTFGHL